jgi:hypothetical protein
LYGSKDESNFNANGGFDVQFAHGGIKFTFNNDEFSFEPIPYSETMFHLAVGLRVTDSAIGLDFFESPFHKSPIVGLSSFVSPLPLVEMHHLLGAPTATQITINLTDPNIRSAMGFDRQVLQVVAAQNGWTAVDYLRDTTTPNSITVELPSLGGNIESYDGISQASGNCRSDSKYDNKQQQLGLRPWVSNLC